MTTHTKTTGQTANPIAYIRADGFAAERQQDAVRSLAEAKGFSDLTVYADHQTRGKSGPAWQRLTDDITRERTRAVFMYGPELSHRWDAVAELVDLVELAREHGVTVHCATLDDELTSPDGLAKLRIFAAFTQWEDAQHSRERAARSAYAARRRAGRAAAQAAPASTSDER